MAVSKEECDSSRTIEICEANVNPDCRVGLCDFKLLKVIGRGGYGKVFLVRRVSEGCFQGRLFAMKVLKKASICHYSKNLLHTLSERSILERIRHQFLVKLHFAFQNNSHLYMILQYCPGGELFSYLEKEGTLSESAARFYLAEITLALGHLHSLRIIYRDLKPENILLDARGHCKLTDFGLSKESVDRTNTYCGTKEYMAPEIWSGGFYDKSVDWWSLGNLLYDMLYGRPPFSHIDKKQLMHEITSGFLVIPSTFSQEAVDLVTALLQKQPSRRLGYGANDVQDVKAHLFFSKSGTNWDQVLLGTLEPPYKPFLTSDTDTCMFDENFTNLPLCVSPADPVNGDYFKGFSYFAEDMAESVTHDLPHYQRHRRRTLSQHFDEEPPGAKTIPTGNHYGFNIDRSHSPDVRVTGPLVNVSNYYPCNVTMEGSDEKLWSSTCETNTDLPSSNDYSQRCRARKGKHKPKCSLM